MGPVLRWDDCDHADIELVSCSNTPLLTSALDQEVFDHFIILISAVQHFCGSEITSYELLMTFSFSQDAGFVSIQLEALQRQTPYDLNTSCTLDVCSLPKLCLFFCRPRLLAISESEFVIQRVWFGQINAHCMPFVE